MQTAQTRIGLQTCNYYYFMTVIDGEFCMWRACYKQKRDGFQPSSLIVRLLWTIIKLHSLWWEIGGPISHKINAARRIYFHFFRYLESTINLTFSRRWKQRISPTNYIITYFRTRIQIPSRNQHEILIFGCSAGSTNQKACVVTAI